MAFLDEKIAKMQKCSSLCKEVKINKDNVCEKIEEKFYLDNYTQEDINKAIKNGSLEFGKNKLDFECNSFYNGNMKIYLPSNYFDDKSEYKSMYLWKKNKEITVGILNKKKKKKKKKIVKFDEVLKYILKRKKIFIECIEFSEQNYDGYKKYIIQLRIPTKDGYINQYIVAFDLQKEYFLFNFCFSENKRQLWEKIVIEISELIEINELEKE